MSELKPRITENGIDYILVGDYYIPDLKLPEEHRPIGKYGRMHREYLREVHPARYVHNSPVNINVFNLTGWTSLKYSLCIRPYFPMGRCSSGSFKSGM